MTTALDATYSVGRNLSGVGVYSRELCLNLALAHPECRFLHCFRPHKLLRGLGLDRPENAGARVLLDSWPIRAGIFHGLNQRMPGWRPRRAVSTFHDLFVLTADYSTPDFKTRFAAQARRAAERSDLIICVSRHTASMVAALLNVEESRLRVVPHGVRFAEAPEPVQRGRIVLHVGAVQRRKNLVRLVEAFEIACPADWKLVLAGSDGFGAEEVKARIEASPARGRIVLTGWVDDAAILDWYRRASIFAFPSLDEGFGIPVLEAMAQGVPVVAANRSSLPEVCGGAALMADALETESIAAALKRLAEDPALCADLVQRGCARAKEYTWERAAALTWDVYRELA